MIFLDIFFVNLGGVPPEIKCSCDGYECYMHEGIDSCTDPPNWQIFPWLFQLES